VRIIELDMTGSFLLRCIAGDRAVPSATS
jgi:hypothetical protein